MKLLVDTSVIVDFLRQDDRSATWLYSLSQAKHHFLASIITHTELYAGKSVWEKQTAQQDLEHIFSGIKLIPLTQSISQKSGYLKAKYQLDLIDSIIAATALNQKLPLATLNQKHFSSIPSLKLLTPSSQQN